jgi:2-keto-3-deoxy-L-rhamnonate aldolase RhmA
MVEPGSRPPPSSFRKRFAAQEHLTGTIETPTLYAMQIEDPEALEVIDAVLTAEGIDGAFIGRGDLAVALGAAANDAPPVKAAVDTVMAAAKRAQKPVCVMVGSATEANGFKGLGATGPSSSRPTRASCVNAPARHRRRWRRSAADEREDGVGRIGR